jgi:hypothetical protein
MGMSYRTRIMKVTVLMPVESDEVEAVLRGQVNNVVACLQNAKIEIATSYLPASCSEAVDKPKGDS